jgi:hypothetical protein
MKFASQMVFVAVLFVGVSARADVPPPDTQACSGKAAGDACTYGSAGTCQEGTCSRLDYFNWDRDASAGPPSTTYACMKCVPGTTTATATTTATNTNTDSSTSDDGWCSVAKVPTVGRVGSWLMAAAFSLLFLAGRRRSRK